FHAPLPPELYRPSLHDALPISLQTAFAPASLHGRCSCFILGASAPPRSRSNPAHMPSATVRQIQGLPHSAWPWCVCGTLEGGQRSESTRLNSSHVKISYAVFCL